MMRDKSKREDVIVKEEQYQYQYRVPVFPMDAPPPSLPLPPGFLAGKGGKDVNVVWEVDGIPGCLPFQVSQHPKTRRKDDHLLLKTETTSTTTSSSVYNYGEEEEEEEDDRIRSYTSSSLKLSLNYDKVLDAWSNRGSLWADNISNTTAATCYMGEVPVLMEIEEKRCGGREASVLRYKEKRHSRLFSKKIRYQVRKLNADQRPRLKGRFVKRSLEKKIFI